MARLREVLLWAGAALGMLAILTGVAVTFFGFSFLIFRSGSMEPAISTGAVALSRTVEARDIEVGDVVSVVAGNGERITHRVVGTTLRGDEATLVMRGDANAVEDSELYVVTSAERVLADLPWGGYVLAHALTPPGLLALACLSLMLLISGFSRVDDEENDENDQNDSGRDDTDHTDRGASASGAEGRDVVVLPGGRHRGVGRFALATVVVLAVVGSTSGTLAAFTDLASAQTSALNAASIATPATPSVTQGTSSNAVVSWTATSVGPSNLKATSYDVLRYTATSGGTPTVLCAGTTTLTCSDAAPGSATVYYAIRARYGSLWMREGARASFTLAVATPPVTNLRCAGGLLGSADDSYIYWDAPTGATPTGYRLDYVADNADSQSGSVTYGSTIRRGRPPASAVGSNGNRGFTITITALYGTLSSQPSAPILLVGRSFGVVWRCS